MNNNLNKNNLTNFNTPNQPINSINNTQFQTPQQMYYNQQPVNDKKNNKKILLIIVTVVVIVVIAILIKYFTNSKNGATTTESLFDTDTLICVTKDNKYGYIDTNGNFVIEPKYNYATSFYGNYAIVSLEAEFEGDYIEVYEVIDKSEKVQVTTDFSSNIEYIEEYGIWVINSQLYDSSLKKISSDNVEVDYKGEGYLSWINESNKTAGIMDSSGKITYTYKLTNEESYFSIEPSDNDKRLTENYCRIIIENEKYGIVNCDTGKVIYDYTDKYIVNEDDNIFEVMNKDTYEFLSKIYIQNDKILFQASDKNVDFFFSTYGYVQIIDNTKEIGEKYSYIDITIGKVTNEEPSIYNGIDSDKDEWEDFTSIKKFSCDSGYGLKKDEQIKISCEWSRIEYFDLDLYKYLSSQGKEYVIAKKDSKTYLLNLKDGSIVVELNTTYLDTDSKSTFINYIENNTEKRIVYNLLTGKSLSTEYSSYLDVYSNYITLRVDGKTNYYNSDLKLIYIEE